MRNFVSLGRNLATAGQPTEDQLLAVRDAGFEVVVNLGLLDPSYCLADEARSAAALGMAYEHVPVDFHNPLAVDFLAFRDVMRRARGRRVFVHCAANYRASCFVALFAEIDLGWSRARADAHVERVWEPNDVWRQYLSDVRAAWEDGRLE